MIRYCLFPLCFLIFYSCSSNNGDVQVGYNRQGEPILKINKEDENIFGSVRIGFDENGNPVLRNVRGGKKITNRCATPRIKTGFKLYKKAKEYLAEYYKTRNMADLYFAWYSAEDAKFLARDVRKCRDKKNTHFYAVQNLVRYSNIVEDMIIPNLKPPDVGMPVEIYLEEYQTIIPNEIQ